MRIYIGAMSLALYIAQEKMMQMDLVRNATNFSTSQDIVTVVISIPVKKTLKIVLTSTKATTFCFMISLYVINGPRWTDQQVLYRDAAQPF